MADMTPKQRAEQAIADAYALLRHAPTGDTVRLKAHALVLGRPMGEIAKQNLIADALSDICLAVSGSADEYPLLRHVAALFAARAADCETEAAVPGGQRISEQLSLEARVWREAADYITKLADTQKT